MRASARVWLSAIASLMVTGAAGTQHDAVLDNGLRVILIPHHANPMVASSVIVGAGVVDEPESIGGVSHFLEHLLFNGTETRTQRELYDEVDRLGAYNNATTREDHTLFTFLGQKESTERGLALQADMLFHSILPQDKFEKEKGIVLEELARDRNDPAYSAEQGFRAFAYAGTPLARSILGTEAGIGSMKREQVLAYYKSRYVPRNMTLVVMGDFEVPEVLTIIRRTFGAVPGGEAPAATNGSWPAAPAKNLSTMPLEGARTYLHAAFPLPLAPFDAKLAAVELLVASVASGEDAPLARDLRSGAHPLVLSFSLSVAPRELPWSVVEFEAVLPEGQDFRPVLERMAAHLSSLTAGTPARDRVVQVRSAARAEEILRADQIHYYGMTCAPYVVGSPPGYLSRRLEDLDGLAAADLDRAAEAMAQGLSTVRIHVAGPGLAGEAAAWKPPSIPHAASSSRKRVVSLTLPSGMEAVLGRNEDSKVFAAHVLFRPRSASEPEGKGGIVDFLHRMFLKGSLLHDAAGLAARLADLGARIKVVDDPSVPYDDDYTTSEFSFVRLELPVDHWKEGIALLAEIVRFPRLRDEDVEAVRAEMLDLLKRRRESSREACLDLTARTLAPAQPLARPVLGTPLSVGSITAADLRAFHVGFVSGRRMIVTAVGPLDPNEVLRALQGAFGDLPAGSELPVAPPAPITPAGLRANDALGKEQAYLGLAYLFDAEPGDQAALSVAGVMLSDKLSFKLREEQGLAYSLGASFRPFGGRMRFEAVMGTRQANVDQALSGLRRAIAEFVSADVDSGTVERAVNALRGRLLMRRLTRINQAYFTGIERMEGRSPGDDLTRIDSLKTLSAEDIRRVIAKYLDPGRCAVIVVR